MNLRSIAGVIALAVLLVIGGNEAVAQDGNEANFATRRAFTINNASPNLTLSNFEFSNWGRAGNNKFNRKLNWTNSGERAIIAFEVVMLFYDPFNRPIVGLSGRRLVTGESWSPIKTAQSGTVDVDRQGIEGAHDGVVYVSAIRFEDGSVWYCNDADVEKQIKALMPTLKEVGPIDPDAQAKKPPS